MTVETETILIKLLEELKADFKELKEELKADFKELKSDVKEMRKDVTDLKVGQAELKGEVKVLQLVIGAVFVSIIGAIVKFVFFPNP